jgi:hypothetical protein
MEASIRVIDAGSFSGAANPRCAALPFYFGFYPAKIRVDK